MDEHEARDLLHRAAETVDVGPAGPLDPPARVRRWPVLVAAAAAVVVLVTAITLARTVLTPTPLSPVTQPSQAAVDPTLMPSLLGYTGDEAVALLHDTYGQAVEVSHTNACGVPASVLGSSPPPGASLAGRRHGVGITVVESGHGHGCYRQRAAGVAFDLLHFARGLGPAPAFARQVSVYVGQDGPTVLSAAAAADPAVWAVCGTSSADCPNPLSALVAEADTPQTMNDTPQQTYLYAHPQRPGPRRGDLCNSELPATLRARDHLEVSIAFPVDGVSCAADPLDVFTDDAGRIDAVVLRQPRESATPTSPVPSDPDPTQTAIARGFLAFARGGAAPSFADTVRLLLGNRPLATISGAEASGDRAAWEICSLPQVGYTERSCPLSALVTAARGPAATFGTVERRNASCSATLGRLPPDLATPEALARSISVGIPEPDRCAQDWQVQLWYDATDRIDAVNLVLGSP